MTIDLEPQKWRLLSTKHPKDGMIAHAVSPNVSVWAEPFENWGMKLHVHGPKENFTVECTWFRLYPVDMEVEP